MSLFVSNEKLAFFNKQLQGFILSLSERTEKVIVRGTKSGFIPVTSRVSQRPVLGSLLFLVCINDLPDSVKNKIGHFTDDSTVYNKKAFIVDSKMPEADLRLLQHPRWSSL